MTNGPVTKLLLNFQAGDASALDELTPLVYPELRRIAGHLLRREKPGHTLQATALVHEGFLKLAGQAEINAGSRAHLLSTAARMMRQILVDHSRTKGAVKRGSGQVALALDEAKAAGRGPARDLVALNDALTTLAAYDQRKATIIEMRYFGGLTGEEIAEALTISTATVARELRAGQAWLGRMMTGRVSEPIPA